MSDFPPRATHELSAAVVRAALACLDHHGFIFQTNHSGSYVIKPDAVRRLENALARLKEARRKK